MIATIAGVGGGVMSMPILLLLLHFEPLEAKGTSSFTILLSAGIALYIHLKNGKIHLFSSFIMALFAILGSLACAFFQMVVSMEDFVFYIIFGVFEIVMGIRFGIKGVKSYPEEHRITPPKNPIEPLIPNVDDNLGNASGPPQKLPLNLIQNPKLLVKAIPLFFLAGFTANFFGIGGGVINTPTLYGVFNLPIHYATAGSTAIIFFTAIFNTIVYGIQGKINWVIGISMGIGMIAGARIGAKTASKIPRWLTLLIIATLLVFTGFRIILGVL